MLPISERVRIVNYLLAIERGRRDTEFFASYFLGVKSNDFQKRLYAKVDEKLAADESVEGIVKPGNRTGKTVAIAVLMLKFAFYKIGSPQGEGFDQFEYNVFDLSPKSRQAKQCLTYMEQILEGRFTWVEGEKRVSNAGTIRLTHFLKGQNENLGRMEFENGSKAYAVGTGSDQAKSVAGLAGGAIFYDEAPMSHHLRDELVGNIYSRLGDYGRLLLLVGTPEETAPSQQYFFRLIRQAKSGENQFFVVDGSYRENVFIGDKQREQHIQRVTTADPEKAQQVIEGAFVTTGGVMFDNAVIDNLWNELKEDQPPIEGHDYLISVDWGLADQGDPTVMMVIDYTESQWKVVAAYAKRGGDPWDLMARLTAIQVSYNSAKVVMDTASLGGTVFKKLLKDLKPISFNGHADGGKVKKDAQTFLHLALTKGRRLVKMNGRLIEQNANYGLVRSRYLPTLEEQLAQYKADDEDLEQDWVVALYQGVWWLYKKFHGKTEEKKSHVINRFRRQRTGIRA